MGETSYLQTSFLGGEWSQTYQGRMDDPHYRTALSVCLNCYPTETGALTRRGGSQFLATTRGGGQGRVISFDIKESNPYALCFTDGFLRFMSFDAAVSPIPFGIFYSSTNDAQTVLDISTANPAVVKTAAAHGWSTGNTVFFAGLGTGVPILQNRQFTITVVNATHFSLQDALTGANINGAGFGSFTSGTVARIAELATTYLSGTWTGIISVQAETTAVLLNGTQPQILKMLTAPMAGVVDATFSLSPSNFIDGPYLDPTPGSIATYDLLQGNVTLTFSFEPWSSSISYNQGDFVVQSGQGYQSLQNANLNNTPPNATWWTPVNGGAPVGPNGFTSGDIGRQIRLFSEPPAWVVGTTYAVGAVVGYPGNGVAGTTYWISLVGSNLGIIPGTKAANWALVSGAVYALWTWGRIISVSGAGLITPVGAIGNMTNNGGLAAAVDGNVNKNFGTSAASAIASAAAYAPFVPNQAYAANSLVYGNNGNNYTCVNTFALFFGSLISTTPTGFYLRMPGSAVGGVAIGNYFFWQSGGSLHFATDLGPQGPTNTNMFNSLGPAPSLKLSANVGQNYTASPKAIQQVTIFPSNDFGFASNISNSVTLLLIGSQDSSIGNGVTLGRFSGSNSTSPITIQSSDTVTTWTHVWVRIIIQNNAVLPFNGTNIFQQQAAIAQVEFFNANVNNGSVVVLQLAGPPLLYPAGTVINTWRAGLFTGSTQTWPTCGCYHEGRLWLAGAVSNRWDASQSNDIFAFSPTGPDGTVADDNSITFTADADGVNNTLWMATDALGIVVGTEGGEWLLQSTTQGLPITPSNVQAHRITKVKCAPIEPQRCEHTLVGVQRQQRKIVEWFADVFSGKFTAPNLMERSRHLAVNLIEEIRYAQEITPIIWMRDGAGLLYGCTYKRDTLMTSQGPTYYGWHRHQLGSGRLVESIAVCPSNTGALDTLVMVTNDTVTGVRHIEMLNSFFEETDNYQNAWLLDDAVTPSSYQINIPNSVTINGLWHLNGKTVQVFTAGLDCGLQDNLGTISDFTVSNGSVTVLFGDGIAAGSGAGLFTQAFVNNFSTAAMPIVVGFTFTSQGQMLRPVSPAETGARAGPGFGKKRRNHRFAVQVEQTNGFSIGSSLSKLDPVPFRPINGAVPVLLPNLFSGVFQGEVRDDYSYDGQICWQISRPVPGLVTAIGGFVDTADV